MNLLKNVKLMPISTALEPIQEEVEELKPETVYDSTESIKTDDIEADTVITPQTEVIETIPTKSESVVPSQELLMPLDPEGRTSRKPDHIPPNIFVSYSLVENVMTYRMYLTNATDKVLPYILKFLENVPADCKVILILSGMNINKLGVSALLSTMSACKAHITTHANNVTSLTDFAVWASGDTITVSNIAFVLLRNMCTGSAGNLEDLKIHLQVLKRIQARIRALLVLKNIITEDEAVAVFDDNKIQLFTGTELQRRLS